MSRMKKGADAIFSEVITSKSEVRSDEDGTSQLEVIPSKSELRGREEERTSKSEVITKNIESITPKSEGTSHDLEHPPYNLELLTKAVTEGEKNSRISLWSPKVRIGLLYLSMTTPRFSMSDETRQMLEAAFEAKYPELDKKLKEELDKRKLERAQSK
jgi:hypothetical protein